MKKKLTLILSLFSSTFIWAQAITEFKDIPFYEHHSSDMTNAPFSQSANGSKSGYDFVNKKYYNSFNTLNMGAYSNGEEANIDMVEHNGPFGTGGASLYLGFTSGVSTIWGGEIKGNGITKWHKVTNGITVYNNLTNYVEMQSSYNSAIASVSVAEVKKDEVYIGRIRNMNLYVMIKCTNVGLPKGPPDGSNDNNYFVFDYKIGSENGPTGIADIANAALAIYPNPVNEKLTIQSPLYTINKDDLQLFDITGKQIELSSEHLFVSNQTLEINMAFLPAGFYTVKVNTEGKIQYISKFLKVD